MDPDREQTVVRTFFVPRSHERWLAMLRKPKKRAQVVDALNHLSELDPRFTEEVASLDEAQDRLLSLGAPATCYAFSDVAGLEGQVMELSDALRAAEDGGWGTILDCIPGQLAYYVGEHAEQRLVLHRAPA